LVHGRFNDFSGLITSGDGDLSKAKVDFTIKTASINTDVKMRDDDLRSANYFDAATFPEITFESKSIEKTGHGYVAVGDLSIHGITKSVRLPFQPSARFTIHGNRHELA